MTVHIAAAGENSGRILVWMPQDGDLPEHAMSDTIAVASAYGAEIESMTIDDGEIACASTYSIARVVQAHALHPAGGKTLQATTAWNYALLSERSNRAFAREARRRSVPFIASKAVGDGLGLIGNACRDNGPWNAIVVPDSEPVSISRKVDSIFASVDGITAVIIPAQASRQSARAGQIVAIVEDHDSMSSILRVAERLSGAIYLPIVLIVAASHADEARWLESQARLLDSSLDILAFETVLIAAGDANPLRDRLLRLRPRFLIARYGGIAAPEGNAAASNAANTSSTLFLVR